jgi:hypothetical protein
MVDRRSGVARGLSADFLLILLLLLMIEPVGFESEHEYE